MKEFIIPLPFEYKKAVLTQARSSRNRPYAFIAEFNDGSRRFIKGPFKNAEAAVGHVICNEVKRLLHSKYLHPIQCEIKEYGTNLIFLECEELGKADLERVTKKKTNLENNIFTILEYGSNDFVPDPFAYLTGVNDSNRCVWTEVMINYCFRWVFGIGDTARRNFMLQKSTGNVYSTDETGIENVNHSNIWGGKKPDIKTFILISDFIKSEYLNKILHEVERWRGYLDLIRRDIVPLSRNAERKINTLLKYSIIAFDV